METNHTMTLHIEKNVSLLPYHTMKLWTKTKYLVHINQSEDLRERMQTPLYHTRRNNPKKLPLMVLWGGSNIIYSKDRDGIVLRNNIQNRDIHKETENYIDLNIMSGTIRDEVVRWSVSKGYSGIENLVAIPGTVGWAAIQNIGAYWQEVSRCIQRVQGIDLLSKQAQSLNSEECDYGYRSSIFKSEKYQYFFIHSIVLRLQKHHKKKKFIPVTDYGSVQEKLQQHSDITPQDLAQCIQAIRKEKLPDRKKIGVAGSFFKNPIIQKEQAVQLQTAYQEQSLTHISDKLYAKHPTLIQRPLPNERIKLAAGQLIELCWRKGYKKDGVGTYHKHALTLIHTGWANATTFMALVHAIQKDVHDTFGIQLDPEVSIYTS